mmetsp:Transcript_8364/g.11285  ORF Transcript_8364/g.11285 Transcript_8364/m.11285 type:complete len:274 (-) Transcript_8364:154-975(-)
MQVLCSECKMAVASILCADEDSVLCLRCDDRANASNFENSNQRIRVQLHSEGISRQPKCDICQNENAFVFCRDDRAVLCRRCDMSIHAPNTLAEKHDRFLLTGIKVGIHVSKVCSDSETSANVKDAGNIHRGRKLHCDTEASCSKSSGATNVPNSAYQPHSHIPPYKRQKSADSNVDTSVKGKYIPPNMSVDEFLDIPGLANSGYTMHDIGNLLAEDFVDFDFESLLEVPVFDESESEDQNSQQELGCPHSSIKRREPDVNSSDETYGAIPAL